MRYTKDTLEALEIFWNPKNKTPRSKLTDFLAAYIETGDMSDPNFSLKMNLFNLGMGALEYKGLVISETYNAGTAWSLTKEGYNELHKKHPTFKIVLESFIESTPSILIIISGIIGFVASIAGIIQFYAWLFPKS